MFGWRGFLAVGMVASSLVLGACGGGASTDQDLFPAVNRAPVASAVAPQTAVIGAPLTLDGSASLDPDGDALHYRWELTSFPPGASVGLSDPTQPRPTFVPTLAGAYTWSLVVSDGALDSPVVTATVVVHADNDGGTTALEIVIDPPEPVTGIVVFTLSGRHDGRVSWFLDLQPLGPVEGSENAMMSWNTAGAATGPHLIVARLFDDQGGWREIRRSFEVGVAPVSLMARVKGTTGLIAVDVNAYSPYGIESVSATLDGQFVARLDQRNGCGVYTLHGCFGPPFSAWLFTLDAEVIGPGRHTMLIIATDLEGRSHTLSQEIVVGPLIALDWPRDGSVVYGTLRVSGRVRAEPPADVEVTVLLNGTPVLNSRGPDFAGQYDLTGVNPNRYVLTVRATDGTGLVTQEEHRIAVAPSANWVQAPSFSLYPGQLLAARGTQALYDAGLTRVMLRDMLTGAEAMLDYEGYWHPQFGGWTLGSGRVYAEGNAGDCNGNCLYQWDGSGRRINLTAANPFDADTLATRYSTSLHAPRVQGNRVVFQSLVPDPSRPGSWPDRWRLVLYDAANGGYTLLADSGEGGPEAMSYDLIVRGAVTIVVYGGSVAGAAPARYAVYEWRSDTGVSRLIDGGTGSIANVRTDGQRVMWVQWPDANQQASASILQSVPIGGGVAQTLVTPFTASAFEVQEDGSVSWGESLWIDGTVRTLPPAADGQRRDVFAAGLGWIFYIQASNNTLYAWNATTGQTEPVFDSNARKGYVTDGHLVFQYLGAVYRLPLVP